MPTPEGCPNPCFEAWYCHNAKDDRGRGIEDCPGMLASGHVIRDGKEVLMQICPRLSRLHTSDGFEMDKLYGAVQIVHDDAIPPGFIEDDKLL